MELWLTCGIPNVVAAFYAARIKYSFAFVCVVRSATEYSPKCVCPTIGIIFFIILIPACFQAIITSILLFIPLLLIIPVGNLTESWNVIVVKAHIDI